MKDLLRYSRHRDRLGLICTSQRASEVSTSLTDAARMAVIFNTDQYVNQEAICRRFAPIKVEDITGLRPCIYDDVNRVCLQHPQCIVWLRGQGFKVYSLGDKVHTGENPQWEQQEHQQQEELEEPLATPVKKEGTPGAPAEPTEVQS